MTGYSQIPVVVYFDHFWLRAHPEAGRNTFFSRFQAFFLLFLLFFWVCTLKLVEIHNNQ
jgi:hypothetical protein